ncbi:unnamed protein product [Penicillium olsonii]|nr:unnamed protein product [Penicillium olsonii]CAG7923450.1 unnamed protein product [Penicillium olsonii]
MPPRQSSRSSPSLLSLSEIINLEPEEEPWCAGYAPSQRRRCHARTNARGRRSAMALLDKGTERLHAGLSIDTLLEDLAPHVLCTRFHQNQASELSSRFKRKVRTYLQSETPTTPSSRTASLSSQSHTVRSSGTERGARAALLRKLRETLDELRRLEDAESDRQHDSGSSSRRETESLSRTVSPRTSESPSRGQISQEPRVARGVERRPTEYSVFSLTATVPAVTQAPFNFTGADETSRQAQGDPSTVARVSSRTNPLSNAGTKPRVTRREIGGACGICLCDLHIPNEDEHTTEADAGTEHGTEDGQDGNNEDHGDGDEQHEEELTWCKERCGVNFHKQCMDQWLARARTCPACRSKWEHTH